MFDFSFSELVLIGVVALIVIGPERLPKVARTAGHLFGRLQRYVNSVKSDISQEMQLDELRKAGQTFKEAVESSARNLETKASAAEYTMRDEIVPKDKVMSAEESRELPELPPVGEAQRAGVEVEPLQEGPFLLGGHPTPAPSPSSEQSKPEHDRQEKA